MKHVLAGDIGGTNSRFALFSVDEAPRLLYQEAYPSRSFSTFERALREFLARATANVRGRLRLAAASFGIAGPVVHQRVKTTNLPWVIDARAIARSFSIPSVTLLNDLVAVGLGAIASPPSKLFPLHAGRPKRTGGTIAVISAGTGLGEAVFVWDGTEHIACATEGSHVDFAPRTEVEAELLEMLQRQYGHVSYERVASGSTISMLYRFFVERKKVRESKAIAAELAAAKDVNAAIVDLATSGRSEAAARAIDLWSGVYGAEAGNLALKSLSTGGVLVCGGVSMHMAEVLARGLPGRGNGKAKTARNGESPFVKAFLDKGRMQSVLAEIPVAVCREPRAGIIGAAAHAVSRAAASSSRRGAPMLATRPT